MIQHRWTQRICGRFAAAVGLLAILTVTATPSQSLAQVKQGQYVTEAAARLVKLIDKANGDGFKLQDNAFSIGGGWLKQSQDKWVPLFTVNLLKDVPYRFLAAGDADARDVDIEVLDANNQVVASDTATSSEAVVSYTPPADGRFLVRVRLYASDKNLPCVCLGIVMNK